MEPAKWLVVLSAIAVVIGAISVVTSARLDALQVASGFQPDATSKWHDVCEKGVSDIVWSSPTRELRGHGQYPGPSDRGEIFASDKLWYSWFDTGDSGTVPAEIRIKDCGFTFGIPMEPDHAYYRFSYSENGNDWVGFTNSPKLPAGVFVQDFLQMGFSWGFDKPLGAVDLRVHGNDFYPCDFGGGMSCVPDAEARSIVDGAALRVQVFLERRGFPSFGPVLVGEDQLQLRNAVPRVTWSAGGYSVGDTAILDWYVPSGAAPDGDAAYFLTVRDMNTNLPISSDYDTKPLFGSVDRPLSGQERIPVTDSMFSNDLATCRNYLRAEIWSRIIAASRDDATVRSPDVGISVGETPSVVDVRFDKARYLQGDTVTVSWTVTGNATRVHVIALIDGKEIYNREVRAGETSVSFPASTTGWLKVEVRAGNLCSFSDFEKVFAPIGNPRDDICDLFPDAAECVNPPIDLLGIAKAVLAVLAVFIALFLGWWVFNKIPPIEDTIVPLLMTLGVAVTAAILLISAGWFDAVLRPASIAGSVFAARGWSA